MADYTKKQGQYLSYIYYYTKINRQPPAEADIQRFFRSSAPSVHQMILKLEENGFIGRSPGKARSIEVLLPPDQLPDLELTISNKAKMTYPDDPRHAERIRRLVEYTSSSLKTKFPSPFGSAVYDLQSGLLVSQAYDTVLRTSDPTNHAEINAIRKAARKLQSVSLSGCILYSTCEPCPMCMSACIWAELDAVVFGASTMEDANLYWPQASDLPPQELVAHMRREPRCRLIAHVERARCQALFRKCDEARKVQHLELPPHR